MRECRERRDALERPPLRQKKGDIMKITAFALTVLLAASVAPAILADELEESRKELRAGKGRLLRSLKDFR